GGPDRRDGGDPADGRGVGLHVHGAGGGGGLRGVQPGGGAAVVEHRGAGAAGGHGAARGVGAGHGHRHGDAGHRVVVAVGQRDGQRRFGSHHVRAGRGGAERERGADQRGLNGGGEAGRHGAVRVAVA